MKTNMNIKTVVRRMRRSGMSWRAINTILFGTPSNGCRAYWILNPRK